MTAKGITPGIPKPTKCSKSKLNFRNFDFKLKDSYFSLKKNGVSVVT